MMRHGSATCYPRTAIAAPGASYRGNRAHTTGSGRKTAGARSCSSATIALSAFRRENQLRALLVSSALLVGGDAEPRDSEGERRFSEAPPGADDDVSAYGATSAARRSRSGIKKLFGELKKETCRTSNQRARKSRKRVDHQKDADLNPHQHSSPRPASSRLFKARDALLGPRRPLNVKTAKRLNL